MLFRLPSVRLELPADAYSSVSSCWWGLNRFIAHAMALYDTHYRSLYLNGLVASIGRDTFHAYLKAEAGVADYGTGRNARASMKHLMQATGMSESTMHRGRQLLGALGCRTVVGGGRHLTKTESLEQWRRGRPRMTGWTAVAALHESTTLPVDNRVVRTWLDHAIGTPPSRSEVSAAILREEVVSTPQGSMKRCAPRSLDKKGPRGKWRTYDQRAVLLAASVRGDERFPLWVRRIERTRLQGLLTGKAVAGWTVDDVYGAVDDWRHTGKALLAAPNNPPGYLCTVLANVPDHEPPAALERERATREDQAARADWRRQLEEARAQAMNSALEDSPGRVAARKVAGAAADRAQERAVTDQAASNRARYELAQSQRGQSPGTVPW